MSHSGYILSELSQPSPLNRLITKDTVIKAAKESSKTEDGYLEYVKFEMKFLKSHTIELRTNKGDILFYVFRRV